jgi:dephospho-CoA kinase
MILVALTGSATSGKGIVSKRLTDFHSFHATRFADPIKRMLSVGLGLTMEQLDGREKQAPIAEFGGLTARHLMQTLGTEWGRRMVHSDVWVNAWRRNLSEYGDRIVVDDLRFPNEALLIRALGGTIWRINRPSVPVLDHASERFVREIAVDREIQNLTTINALTATIDDAVHDMIEKEEG